MLSCLVSNRSHNLIYLDFVAYENHTSFIHLAFFILSIDHENHSSIVEHKNYHHSENDTIFIHLACFFADSHRNTSTWLSCLPSHCSNHITFIYVKNSENHTFFIHSTFVYPNENHSHIAENEPIIMPIMFYMHLQVAQTNS